MVSLKGMIVFTHGNGFTPGSYKKLLSAVNGEVNSLLLTPLRRNFSHREALSNWYDFSEELLQEIKKLPAPIIGVGHSMGAICLLIAAVRSPELFKGLVLIDPTLLPKRIVAASRMSPQWLSRQINPVASKAYRRKEHWQNNEEAFNHLRQRSLFKNVSDEVLKQHVDSSLVESIHGGVTLRYTKSWEEHCFTSVINPWPWLRKCKTPTLGIYGEKSDLIIPEIKERWEKLNPQTNIVEIQNAGHLVPLEYPHLVAEKINQFIESLA